MYVISLSAAQIANRNLLHTRLRRQNEVRWHNISGTHQWMVKLALEEIEESTCFTFDSNFYKSTNTSTLVFVSDQPGLCSYEAPVDNSDYTPDSTEDNGTFFINTGGCAGPGDVINLFFAMAGLQPHETRPDRDFYIDAHEAIINYPPLYNTHMYAFYDLNSIMHSSAASVYKNGTRFIARQDPFADPRRFPLLHQMKYLADQAMGQRVLPTALDWLQINNEWCSPDCRQSHENCGPGGFMDWRSDCTTCVCPRHRKGRYCEEPQYDWSVLLTRDSPTHFLELHMANSDIYSVKTMATNCAPGYSPGVKFQFLTNAELYTPAGGGCGDYISIATDDSIALPKEIRLCGIIKSPVKEFTIITRSDILLKTESHRWNIIPYGNCNKEETIVKLNVTAICENLNPVMSVY